MEQTITLITHGQTRPGVDAAATEIDIMGDVNPRDVNLAGIDRVNLHFPKFTDGRAYSQAFLLRRRLK